MVRFVDWVGGRREEGDAGRGGRIGSCKSIRARARGQPRYARRSQLPPFPVRAKYREAVLWASRRQGFVRPLSSDLIGIPVAQRRNESVSRRVRLARHAVVVRLATDASRATPMPPGSSRLRRGLTLRSRPL